MKTLRRILCQKQAASLHTLWALDADGQELASKCFFLSHFRGAGPRFALLTEAELLDDTSMKCRYCSLEGGYADFIDISFIGLFFDGLKPARFDLFYAELMPDLSRRCEGDRVFVKQDVFCSDGAVEDLSRARCCEGRGGHAHYGYESWYAQAQRTFRAA